MLKAVGTVGLDQGHDGAVLNGGGVFENGFFGGIEQDDGNVTEPIVLAKNEAKVAAAKFFTFGFGENEGRCFGLQNFKGEMGGADTDDLVAVLFEDGAIFGGGAGVGIDNQNHRSRGGRGFGFSADWSVLLHRRKEMNGDLVALVSLGDGANDLGTLARSGRVSLAGIGKDDVEGLADPISAAT